MKDSDRRAWLGAAAVVVAVGALVRLVLPELRPIHHDEAVNWYLSGRVVSSGLYHYDPSNYHGPLFFYLTALGRPLAFVTGRLTALRVPTMLAGAAMIPLVLASYRLQGRRAALMCGAFLALSPTAVFYARDAIHETWLALFTLGAMVWAGLALRSDRPVRDLAIAGACIGGMVATKETAVLTFAGWGVALLVLLAVHGRGLLPMPSRRALGAAALSAGVVVLVVFSGYGRAPGDLMGLFETLVLWGNRGMEGDGHEKAWWTFGWWLLRGEGPFVLIAVVALLDSLRTRDPGDLGLATWLLVTTALYSAISYKTPWCLFQLTLPAALLAGRWTARRLPPRAGIAVAGLALIGAAALTTLSSFVRYDEPDEPLVYVQTHRRSEEAASAMAGVLDAVGDEASLRYFYSARYPFNWYLDRGGLEPEHVDGVLPENVDGDVIVANPHELPEIQATISHPYFWQRFRFREGMQLDVWVADRHVEALRDPSGWELVGPVEPDAELP